MFWKFNLLTSHIDTLLDKEDLTLHEILDEDDVLQECKAQNKRLVEFLVLPANLEELVNYITREPSDETDEKYRYKYPNTACELLISDVNQITESLAGDNTLMAKIYGFLEGEAPLNPLLASFFSKVMGLLIARKSDMMLEFLQTKDDFVGHLLRHLGTSAIMDLLLRLITCIEAGSECHIKCLSWLSEMQLIQKLVSIIDPNHPEEKHCNACQSLCDIIRLSREQMSQLQERADPDPLLSAIEAEETIRDLLRHLLDGEKVESVLVNGITVLQHLLEFKRLGPDGGSEPITSLDAERLALSVQNTVQALTPRLKDFHQLLVEPPKQHYAPMTTTVGILNPPLGNTRLQVAKLVASLLFTRTQSINAELANLGSLGVLIDLCFEYQWNNFLHTQMEAATAIILGIDACPSDTNEEDPLLTFLLSDYKFIEKVLDVWEDNEQQQSRPGGHRKGYMGHLTRMANNTVECMDKGPTSEKIKAYFEKLPEETQEKWTTFTAGSLTDTNKLNTVELVSVAGGQNLYSSSEDDDPEFRDIAFPQDTAMQQAFSDCQLQQMTSNFIDQFGFNEEDFGDAEERVSEKFQERKYCLRFDGNTEEITNSAAIFEQVCNDKILQFDDQENDDDLWEEKEITFSQSTDSRQNSGSVPGLPIVPPTASPDSDDNHSDSSSGDEELDSPLRIHQTPESPIQDPADGTTTQDTAADSNTMEKMDVDNSDSWARFDDISMDTQPTLAATDPGPTITWPEATSLTPESSPGWAAFDVAPTNPPIQVPSERASKGDSWADFTNIGESGTADSTEARKSPVAMDTNESTSTSSRTAAYLVASAPADLASDIRQCTTQDSTLHTQQTASSVEPESSNIVTSSDISSTTTPPLPSSPPPAAPSTPPTSSASPAISPPPATSPQPESSTTQHTEPDSFLAAAGLIKGLGEGNEPDPDPGNVNDTTGDDHSKLEEIRAQAQEALKEFTTATSSNSSENGPV